MNYIKHLSCQHHLLRASIISNSANIKSIVTKNTISYTKKSIKKRKILRSLTGHASIMIMISFISFSWNLYWNIYRFFSSSFLFSSESSRCCCCAWRAAWRRSRPMNNQKDEAEERRRRRRRRWKRDWRDVRRKRGNCTEVAYASLLGSHLTLAPPTSRPSGVTTSGAAFIRRPRHLIGWHEAAYLFSRIHSRSAGTNGCSAPSHSRTPSFHFSTFYQFSFLVALSSSSSSSSCLYFLFRLEP